VDDPRRRPHGVQGTHDIYPGKAARSRARDTVWAEPGDSSLVDRKVSMGRIHGPRRGKVLALELIEGVGRRRSGGSPAGKVGVQRLREQLHTLAKFLDLHTRMN
jgi:hypothetical protein